MVTIQAVDDIVAALNVGDLQAARHYFDLAARNAPDEIAALLKQLAAAVNIPRGAIVCGAGIDVWGNPHRDDFAWRCGNCPWTGSGYQSARGARTGAERHGAAHWENGEPVPAVREYDETQPRGAA